VFDLDPVMKTDRLASAILVFPGGRQLVFSSATQLAPHQRFQMTGTRGRLEFRIPFNPPPDRPAALILDDCRDLFGGGRSIEEFAPVNQYTLQGEAFARFVRSGEALAHPVSDAVAGMRIIDALFRSGRSGRWEDVNE